MNKCNNIPPQHQQHSIGSLDMEMPKYSYWRYYLRRRSEWSARCRICGRMIKMGAKASTGGLMRHLHSMHKDVFKEFTAERANRPKRRRMEASSFPIADMNDDGMGVDSDYQQPAEEDEQHSEVEQKLTITANMLNALLQTSLGILNGHNDNSTDEGNKKCKVYQEEKEMDNRMENEVQQMNIPSNNNNKLFASNDIGPTNGRLSGISDADIIARLNSARSNLRETMEEIDALSAELTLRQQLRAGSGAL